MSGYRHFTLCAYFVAHAAVRITRDELEKQLSFMEKHLRLDKIYLEPFRGEFASHEQIEMCKEIFKKHGIKVAGGLTTVMDTPEGDPAILHPSVPENMCCIKQQNSRSARILIVMNKKGLTPTQRHSLS